MIKVKHREQLDELLKIFNDIGVEYEVNAIKDKEYFGVYHSESREIIRNWKVKVKENLEKE